jgi:hypothetical protein
MVARQLSFEGGRDPGVSLRTCVLVDDRRPHRVMAQDPPRSRRDRGAPPDLGAATQARAWRSLSHPNVT